MSDDTMHNRFSLDTSGNHLEAVKQEINGITKKNSPGQHKMMKLLIVFESCKEWIWHSEVFILEVETEKDQEINERIICHVHLYLNLESQLPKHKAAAFHMTKKMFLIAVNQEERFSITTAKHLLVFGIIFKALCVPVLYRYLDSLCG